MFNTGEINFRPQSFSFDFIGGKPEYFDALRDQVQRSIIVVLEYLEIKVMDLFNSNIEIHNKNTLFYMAHERDTSISPNQKIKSKEVDQEVMRWS